uniref:Uncharacterized protein n=1 Tax=Pinguiococcus pyrenoidosus TaxID=172671 RepID=A0A6U0UZZ3_9STRA|mmetsp:Transcript_17641/g.67079  ORF Transcript_17641/g.67079 Transcript_17641/m.67079 type:complete len:194 (+) Transcript_17641:213-794(+)
MRTVALLAALVCLLRPASSFGVGVRVGASTTHVARTGTQRGTRQRAFVKGPGDDDVEDAPRKISREAEILEGIEGTAPTNIIVPPFLRTTLYGIFAITSIAGITIGVQNLSKDFGKSVTDIGINCGVLIGIAILAFVDNKNRNASLQEVQRQLESDYLKKDSPFFFDNAKRAKAAAPVEAEETGDAVPPSTQA